MSAVRLSQQWAKFKRSSLFSQFKLYFLFNSNRNFQSILFQQCTELRNAPDSIAACCLCPFLLFLLAIYAAYTQSWQPLNALCKNRWEAALKIAISLSTHSTLFDSTRQCDVACSWTTAISNARQNNHPRAATIAICTWNLNGLWALLL